MGWTNNDDIACPRTGKGVVIIHVSHSSYISPSPVPSFESLLRHFLFDMWLYQLIFTPRTIYSPNLPEVSIITSNSHLFLQRLKQNLFYYTSLLLNLEQTLVLHIASLSAPLHRSTAPPRQCSSMNKTLRRDIYQIGNEHEVPPRAFENPQRHILLES